MISPLVTFGTFALALPTTTAGLLILIIGLVLLWVVVSVPVYAAGKMFTGGKAGFGDAMGATLGGAIAYFLVLWGVSFFLSFLIGPAAIALGFVLALVVWLAVYRASFDTGWLGAIGIVGVAWLVFFVLDVFLVVTFGVGFPKFYPF
jgi:hypothetical protein